MKVIPGNRNSSSPKTGHELLEKARQFEKENEPTQAVTLYERMIRKNYQKELGYQRIMILLRRLGDRRKELEVIDNAISEFKRLYDRRNTLTDKKAINTSKKLKKLMGFTNDLYEYPQPIPRWMKRKKLLSAKTATRKK
jgi:hypothetical protein